MPPRLNRKQRKNEVQFQVVRDENGEVVFRTLQAPQGVKTRADLQKHLPADFPLDIIEENNGKVQTRFSRESDGIDDGEDAALAERLLKDMTLHDIGFNDNDDTMDFDFDDVDEVVDYDELEAEYGGRNNRNAKLMGEGSYSNEYAYDYNKHFKAMTPHSTFFIPGVGVTVDPEADQPIIPAVPVVDDVFEEDLKNDVALKERGEKISKKVKKTIHSDVSGLDLPVFESSGYKFTDDFLHPLLDGDVEGYEELEDNIFELLLQSDGEEPCEDDGDEDPFGFGIMSRDDIIAKMRNKSDVDQSEPQSKLMSLADFEDNQEEEQEQEEKPKKKSQLAASITKNLKKFNLTSALKKINKTSSTLPAEEDQTTSTTFEAPKAAAKTTKLTGKRKGVSFSSKSTASNGEKSKKITTKGTQSYGSSLGGFDDEYGDNEEEFNPDDMFGYGDDDDVFTSKVDDNDPDFGYGDDDNDNDADFGYGDEEEEDEDEEQDQVDLQIQERLEARIRAQYSPDDDVTVQITYGDDEEEEYGEGESYDPFDDAEGEFDDVMSQYLQQMTGPGDDDYDEDEDYYDEDYYDEDDEEYESRRGHNRDQVLTVVPSTDPILAEKEYALFQRLVNVYECDNSTDEDEFENGEYQDEDDEKYMFHINRDGVTLKNPDIRKAISDFQSQKASTQKEYRRMRSRLKPNVKEFIRNSVIEQQATPQPSLEQLQREIDRQFAKKKQSRLDVQSMRTTLSSTANVPTLIKEVRIRPAKRVAGTKLGTTAIIADVQVIGVDGLPVVQAPASAAKGSRSVSFADEPVTEPRQIKLDHRGVPIGVLEKHREERQQKEAEYKATLANAIAEPSAAQPKPRIQLNFTQPVSVSFQGEVQQFPIVTPDVEKDQEEEDSEQDEDDQEDEDYEGEEGVYIAGARRNKKETAEERRERKKLQKEHKSQRRIEKKKTKTMFKQETKKAKQQEMAIKFTNPAHKKLM